LINSCKTKERDNPFFLSIGGIMTHEVYLEQYAINKEAYKVTSYTYVENVEEALGLLDHYLSNYNVYTKFGNNSYLLFENLKNNSKQRSEALLCFADFAFKDMAVIDRHLNNLLS
jgi:hypothetical protein